MAISKPKTLAYYEGVRGWPSHYTFIPEGMVSLNNRFFSFKEGQIWEHNVNPETSERDRNTFYNDVFTLEDGISNSQPSIIEFIFNDGPQLVKNFKTISWEGDGDWKVEVFTDQESELIDRYASPERWSVAGTINASDFVTKEGKRHAWIRGNNSDDIDFKSFTINGISFGDVNTVNDTVTFTNEVSSKLNVGDELYFFRNTGTQASPVYQVDADNEPVLFFAGSVSSVSSDKKTITYSASTRPDGTSITTTTTAPSDDDFFIYSKDRVTETSGLIGFFAIIRMTNIDNTKAAELFAVETELFQSSE